MKKQGYDVISYDERPFNSFIGKAILRFNLNFLIKKHVNKYFSSKITPLLNNIDYLVIINPESITPEILSRIKKNKKNISIIIYMWDSFKNKKNAHALIPFSDSFFTFDPADAVSYQINHLPLFYIPEYDFGHADKNFIYDYVFIGTAHSNRYNLVKKITENFKNTFKFFYTPNKLVFLYKKYFLNELPGLKYSDVSSNSMSRNEVIDIVRKSNVVIDINHPLQIGLTMRTIETLGARKKLITTNKEIENYDFYHPNNILILTNDVSNIEITEFKMKPFVCLDEKIHGKYNLNNWVRRLLS